MEAVKSFFGRLGRGTKQMFKRFPFFFYILAHPFQGFYDLKVDERRKNVSGAVLIFVLLAFSSIFKRQLMGYLFTNRYEQLNLNFFLEITVAVAPYLLWVIANWCFSSLMDGDGKVVDIFCATAVGLIPLIVVNFLQVPLSNMLTLDAIRAFEVIGGAGYVISYIYIFLGMMVTHQYTVKKSLITTIFSILGIAVIAFIILLIFYLIQQVTGFASNLITEISYRLNE